MSAVSRPVDTPRWIGTGARRSRILWRRRLRQALGPLSLGLVTLLFCWKLVFGGLVVIGYDTMTYMYPYRFFAATALEEGRIPLWNPYIYYGAPFLANLQSAVFYPLHVVFLLRPPTEAMNWSVVLHLFLAAFFTYVMGRRLAGLDAVSATVAGALYGLSGFVGSQVGHLNQLNAAAWVPAALLLAHLGLVERRPRWIALLALVMAVQLLAGHAQETYMTVALLAGYAAFVVVWRTVAAWRTGGPTGRASGGPTDARRLAGARVALGVMLRDALWAGLTLGIAGALAVGMAAMQLLPTNELTNLSIRAGGMSIGEASSFSLPPRQLFVGLLPTFGLAAPTSNEYLGWVGFGGLTLALLGLLFRLRRATTVFFTLLALLTFLLALGNHTPVFERFFHVPGMNLFRVPSRWLMLTSLALAMLGGEGLAFLRQLGRLGWPAAGPWQRLAAATRLLAGVFAVAVAAGLLWPHQLAGVDAVPPSLLGIWLGLAGGAVALAFLSLAAAPGTAPAAVFALWVFAELFAASRSLEYNNPNPGAVYTASRPVIDALHQGMGADRRLLSTASTGYHPSDADQLVAPYRGRLDARGVTATLVNTKFKEIMNPNLSMVFGIPTIDGYDGGVLPLSRYITLKRVAVAPEQNLPDALLRDQLRQLPPSSRLRLLGPSDLLMDTIADVTHDGVYYDLFGGASVGPGETLRTSRFAAADTGTRPAPVPGSPPAPPARALAEPPSAVGPVVGVGLVTSLEGAGSVPDGALVATITLGDASGQRWRADLVAGRDTAEGAYTTAVRHRQPTPLTPERPGPAMYLTRLSVEDAFSVSWVDVQSHLPATLGRLRLHGLSLVGGEGQVWPITLAGESLRLVHRSDVKLYRIEDAPPRAYVVEGARLVDGPEAAVEALVAETHRPDRVALLERDPGPTPPAASPLRARARRLVSTLEAWLGVARDPRFGTVPADLSLPGASAAAEAGDEAAPAARVSWVDDSPERVVLRVESDRPGLLVLRDTLFPGWSVQVDGRAAPLLRADVLFRAVPVAAGSHTIEFRYRSLGFERGLIIAAIAAGLTLALAALPPLRWWRRPLDEPAHW